MKTSEVAISTLDDDKLILNPEKTLKESGVSKLHCTVQVTRVIYTHRGSSCYIPPHPHIHTPIPPVQFITGNETEISYFSRTDYESYKANPEMMW